MNKEQLITLQLPYRETGTKTVRVFVPEHSEGELLPVIYMTDGQNLFEDDRPHQFGCWYTREAVREEHKSSGRAAIIVGIHNDESPVQRARELTPKSIGAIKYPDDMPEEIRKMMIPEGEAFDDFVLNTVIPEVESRFPAKSGGAAFCGSSSGGLQAYFTALSHPDRFCLAGVFSPAFPMYYTEDIIRWTRENTSADAPRLYIYSGSGDRLEQEIRESTQAVAEAVSEFYPKEKMTVNILPENRHHESAWAQEFKEFLNIFVNN